MFINNNNNNNLDFYSAFLETQGRFTFLSHYFPTTTTTTTITTTTTYMLLTLTRASQLYLLWLILCCTARLLKYAQHMVHMVWSVFSTCHSSLSAGIFLKCYSTELSSECQTLHPLESTVNSGCGQLASDQFQWIPFIETFQPSPAA